MFKSRQPNPNCNGVTDVSAEEVLKNLSSLTIVDVRRPDEFMGELGHIAEALHIVLDFLPMQIEELPKDKTLVFVCRSGQRSALAASFAMENGYDRVFNLYGGMLRWNELDYPVEGKNE